MKRENARFALPFSWAMGLQWHFQPYLHVQHASPFFIKLLWEISALLSCPAGSQQLNELLGADSSSSCPVHSCALSTTNPSPSIPTTAVGWAMWHPKALWARRGGIHFINSVCTAAMRLPIGNPKPWWEHFNIQRLNQTLAGADQGQNPNLVEDDWGETFQSIISARKGCKRWLPVGWKNSLHDKQRSKSQSRHIHPSPHRQKGKVK